MAIEIKRKARGKMYECQAFFPDGQTPKKWKYVRNLESFTQFLTRDHAAWKYFNVYEKGSGKYLKRFYPGNTVPKVLSLLGFLILFSPMFSSSCGTIALHQHLLKNTSNKTTSTTSNNDFNYCATIPTRLVVEKEGVCTL